MGEFRVFLKLAVITSAHTKLRTPPIFALKATCHVSRRCPAILLYLQSILLSLKTLSRQFLWCGAIDPKHVLQLPQIIAFFTLQQYTGQSSLHL